MNFLSILFPKFNRFIVVGMVLFVVGFFLTPFIIGIPIMTAGWMLSTFGIFYYYFSLFPMSRKIEKYLKEYLSNYVNFWKKVVEEAFKKN